ncbi:MAG: OB-fold domain-containing protein [Actinobacteria bacterium]|nr:OB-fold domain-containing protein [Actinomycetota bacterium]MBU1945202.1 OB-fold domain-containing protein [Actinomycetota bacterium]MBU2687740.1 OB-fold domain-containing protein [Actinomycetota bacterium]
MAYNKDLETREVQATWDVTTYQYKLDGRGAKVLADGMKEKTIRGIKCPQCGRVYVPGPTYCRVCYIDIDDVVDCSDEGVVMSYCIEMADVRGNPMDEHRVSAMIKFDGADTWFIGTVHGIDPMDVKIGMKVKAIWKDVTEGNLGDIQRFEPV